MLFPQPEIEHVISDSPGLEDDVNPSLNDEDKARSLFAEHAEDGVIARTAIAGLLSELDRRFDDDQWTRLVEPWVRDPMSLEQWLELVRRVDGAQYGAKLRKAAAWGDVSKVKDLVARGCDLRGADGLGYTALHYAAQAGHLDVVNAICDKDTLEGADKQGWTPLIVAAANGHVKVVDRLLALGANASATTDYGRTALHWAAAKGRADCVVTLLKKGGDVKAADRAGMTPLHLAAEHGHVAACVKLAAKNDKAGTLLKKTNLINATPIEYQDETTFWLKVQNQTQQQRRK